MKKTLNIFWFFALLLSFVALVAADTLLIACGGREDGADNSAKNSEAQSEELDDSIYGTYKFYYLEDKGARFNLGDTYGEGDLAVVLDEDYFISTFLPDGNMYFGSYEKGIAVTYQSQGDKYLSNNMEVTFSNKTMTCSGGNVVAVLKKVANYYPVNSSVYGTYTRVSMTVQGITVAREYMQDEWKIILTESSDAYVFMVGPTHDYYYKLEPTGDAGKYNMLMYFRGDLLKDGTVFKLDAKNKLIYLYATLVDGNSISVIFERTSSSTEIPS